MTLHQLVTIAVALNLAMVIVLVVLLVVVVQHLRDHRRTEPSVPPPVPAHTPTPARRDTPAPRTVAIPPVRRTIRTDTADVPVTKPDDLGVDVIRLNRRPRPIRAQDLIDRYNTQHPREHR